MTIRVGTVHDRYEFLDVVGEGGMSVVYRARHTVLGSQHAVKVLRDPSRSLQRRLIQEGRLQSNLKHPNIVNVTDVLMIEDTPALVMEYVDGPSLEQLLRSCSLTVAQIDAIGLEILQGVAGAHKVGLVHRDLKPANIMLAIEGRTLRAKITDFGLAKPAEDAFVGTNSGSLLTATTPGAIIGTPAYMAPEQIMDATKVDAQSDIFSLGAVLYELITGRRCFLGSTMLQVWTAINAGRFIPLHEVAPDCPRRMRRVVERAVVVERDERADQVKQLLSVWSSPDPGEETADGPDDVWMDLVERWRHNSAEGVKGSNSYEPKAMLPTIDSATSSDDVRHHQQDVQETVPAPGTYPPAKPPGSHTGDEGESQELNATRKAQVVDVSEPETPELRLSLKTGVAVCLAVLLVLAVAVSMQWQQTSAPSDAHPATDTPTVTLAYADRPEARAQFGVARSYLLEGKFNLAQASLHSLKVQYPDEPAVHHLLAVSYMCQGRSSMGASAIARTMDLGQELKGDLAKVFWLSYRSYLEVHKRDNLLGRWEELLARAGADPVVQLTFMASARHLLGDAEVIARIDRLTADKGAVAPVFSYLALEILESSGDLPAFLERARVAVSRYPELPGFKVALARGLAGVGQVQEAQTLLRAALAQDDTLVAARTELATLLVHKGNESGRMEQLMLALSDINPVPQQQGFLLDHAIGIAKMGRVSDAGKMLDLCVRQLEDGGDPVMSLKCASVGTEIAVWLDSSSRARHWLETFSTLLSRSQVGDDIARFYKAMHAYQHAMMKHRITGDDSSLQAALATMDKLPGGQRLFEIVPILVRQIGWQLQLASDDPDTLRQLMLQVDLAASVKEPGAGECIAVFTGARAAFELKETSVLIRGLERVASGQCVGTRQRTYHYLKATALAMLVETYASMGDQRSATEAVQRFAVFWPDPDEQLPLVLGVEGFRRQLNTADDVR